MIGPEVNGLAVERRYRLAVWTVIASEALLFAGLFALYTSYRAEYPQAFDSGVAADIAWIGGVNTFILLTSSFAMAWSIHRMRGRRPASTVRCLAVVLVLGASFLTLKLVEWSVHIHDGIVPGLAYSGPYHGRGTTLFFTLYYAMTGLHAAHVVAGLALVAWVLARTHRGTQTPERHVALELVGLYWHFVDVVWVFLWPMFYLMHGAPR